MLAPKTKTHTQTSFPPHKSFPDAQKTMLIEYVIGFAGALEQKVKEKEK
jgi:hypothetical protein